jgi:hypothetical protein
VAADDAIYDELVRLRRGSALQESGLVARVGPHLSAASGILHSDSDRAVRDKVADLIRRLTEDFPPHLVQALRVALAIDEGVRYPRLEEREESLANMQHVSLRTARRRVGDATARLAEAIRENNRRHRPDDPEQGWYVSRLRALLCLDGPVAELIEERSIVATQDNLALIATRFDLPPPEPGAGPDRELLTDILHGARLLDVERSGGSHFRQLLALPGGVRQGQERTYVIRHQIPPGQPMAPRYAFAPLMPCLSFELRVRFDPDRLPQTVWLLDRVPPRLLDDKRPGPVLLTPDQAGDLSLEFSDLVQGYGYGLAWRFP